MLADSVNKNVQPRHPTPDYTLACLQNISSFIHLFTLNCNPLHFIASLLLNKINDMDFVCKLKGKMYIIIIFGIRVIMITK